MSGSPEGAAARARQHESQSVVAIHRTKTIVRNERSAEVFRARASRRWACLRFAWNPGVRKVVGATGFEPATPCAQGRCATRLRYAPTLKNLDFTAVFRLSPCFASLAKTVPELRFTVPEYPRFIIPACPKPPPTRHDLAAAVGRVVVHQNCHSTHPFRRLQCQSRRLLVTQPGTSATWTLAERPEPVRLLVRDHDRKLTRRFDGVRPDEANPRQRFRVKKKVDLHASAASGAGIGLRAVVSAAPSRLTASASSGSRCDA